MAEGAGLKVAPRARFGARIRMLEPVTLLWVILVAGLIFLIAAPLLKMLLISFEEQDTGDFTLMNYATAYGRQRYLDALRNSLLLGLLSAAISTIIAVPMAWAVSRTDMPGKGFTWAMVLAAFVMPPYLGAIGWILLAGPNAGWINQVWRAVTGAQDVVFLIEAPDHEKLDGLLASSPWSSVAFTVEPLVRTKDRVARGGRAGDPAPRKPPRTDPYDPSEAPPPGWKPATPIAEPNHGDGTTHPAP
jgi:ABC-type sugar transport system permease subunit